MSKIQLTKFAVCCTIGDKEVFSTGQLFDGHAVFADEEHAKYWDSYGEAALVKPEIEHYAQYRCYIKKVYTTRH